MKPRTLMMRIVIVVAVAVAMSATATAQKGKPAGGPTPIRVDGKVIKSYIEWLAAPEREGRRTLTPGFEKSVEWAVGKFKEWGVKPAGENGTYIQNVPITSRGGAAYAWTTGIPELVVDGRAFLLRDNDFTLDTASTPGGGRRILRRTFERQDDPAFHIDARARSRKRRGLDRRVDRRSQDQDGLRQRHRGDPPLQHRQAGGGGRWAGGGSCRHTCGRADGRPCPRCTARSRRLHAAIPCGHRH